MPKQYTAKQGDCLSSIALEYGHFPATIWNHPDNANLRRLRRDPNILLAGDLVVVPDREPGSVPGATGKRHRFVRRGVPEMLYIQIEDEEGKPVAGAEYRMTLDGHGVEGTTDADGWIEEPIPPNARAGMLVVVVDNQEQEHELELGHLDPIEELTGVQARLQNLGYDCPLNGELDELTEIAVKRFQQQHELEPTGEPDEQTRARLQDEHNS